jgi:molybdopterin-guanine dinucleotide biosynthesis protein A
VVTRAEAGPVTSIYGLILAGGESRRMSDKPFRILAGQPLIAHAIRRATPQVRVLAVSIRGERESFSSLGLPLIGDASAESLGPLAGIASGLRWAAGAGIPLLATFPCDAPFFPLDLVATLQARRGEARVAIPLSDGRIHPVFGVWDTSLADLVAEAIASGERRLHEITRSAGARVVDFAEADPDPFANINTEDDLQAAEKRLADDRASRDL